MTYENIIKKSSSNYEDEISDFSEIDPIVRNWADRRGENPYENIILEILESKNRDKSILLTKNKSLIIPEYILEYNYSLNSTNINISNINKSENFKSQKTAKIITSSYVTKESFSFLQKDEFVAEFNKSLRNLTNCEIKKHLSKEIIENYSNCKPQYFNELNSSELFFSKNSILNFLYMSHRYTNPESFSEEFNKILERLEEIKNLNFKNPLINISENKTFNTPSRSGNLKEFQKDKEGLLDNYCATINTEGTNEMKFRKLSCHSNLNISN